MKSVVEYVKKSFSEFRVIYRQYKQSLHAVGLAAAILIIASNVTKSSNTQLIEENQMLRNEVYKSSIKLQMMVYIMTQQNDSINTYKTYLINCQRQQIDENNKRAR